MTLLDVVFKYGTPPGESVRLPSNNAWEVYGVRKIKFDEKEHTIRVEFDASRLSDGEIAGILRRAGIDLREKSPVSLINSETGYGPVTNRSHNVPVRKVDPLTAPLGQDFACRLPHPRTQVQRTGPRCSRSAMPRSRLKQKADPSRKSSAQDFGWRLRRRQNASKCNEALSRDLWPLDPFESAPMRATSSGICNSIPCANHGLMKIKDLAEFLDEKLGRNSLLLKNLLCGFSRELDLAGKIFWLNLVRTMRSPVPIPTSSAIFSITCVGSDRILEEVANCNHCLRPDIHPGCISSRVSQATIMAIHRYS